MRRAPIVLTSTVAGLVGVLSFKPREPAAPGATAVAPAPSATTAPAPPRAASGATGGSGAAPEASAPSGARAATGDAIATQYGPAQVRVTVSGGRITDVTALQLQGNEPKSVQISSSAAPLLRQSALEKQTAAIDAVSGATVTSASYEASLQSALDKLGFRAADGTRGASTVPQVEEHGGRGDGGPPPGVFPGG